MAVAGFFVYPEMFGGVITEAIVTGIAVGLLSYLIGQAIAYRKRNRAAEVAPYLDS